ncbi:hypothetical protein GGR56DRAFT_676010 [Xylariaceae sp. FL0804]|nr:hypothetical protein GGR56DRAFT_676010 [Xylariaceae sp. FL0804]
MGQRSANDSSEENIANFEAIKAGYGSDTVGINVNVSNHDDNSDFTDSTDIRCNVLWPRDCGTFTFNCKNSLGAWDNAYHCINCVINSKSKLDLGTSPVDNGVSSGCTTSAGKTLCRLAPISQRTWNQVPDNIAKKPLQCYEFPLNVFKQDNFEEGVIRNSLRHIHASDNAVSGFSQFGQFVYTEGDWAKGGAPADLRKFNSQMQDGATFELDCIIDGANDPERKKTGTMSQPYNYLTNNHYAIIGLTDIMQYCVLIIRYQGGISTTEVLQVNGKEMVSKGKTQTRINAGEHMEVTRLPKSLSVFSQGDLGIEVNFQYGTSATINFFVGDLIWSIKVKGVAGAYGTASIGYAEQKIQCDFPRLI